MGEPLLTLDDIMRRKPVESRWAIRPLIAAAGLAHGLLLILFGVNPFVDSSTWSREETVCWWILLVISMTKVAQAAAVLSGLSGPIPSPSLFPAFLGQNMVRVAILLYALTTFAPYHTITMFAVLSCTTWMWIVTWEHTLRYSFSDEIRGS